MTVGVKNYLSLYKNSASTDRLSSTKRRYCDKRIVSNDYMMRLRQVVKEIYLFLFV